jgi:hypothetical protein
MASSVSETCCRNNTKSASKENVIEKSERKKRSQKVIRQHYLEGGVNEKQLISWL